ncbi:MAG: FAD-dependent oxidoreductase, partial [Gammaproteobacteria bacterium]|nr:FAD-dependent oxidoreductase [Gammaproteobacteria bacterium]
DFAQREVNWILGIGGIEVRAGESLGEAFTLDSLREEYDAVFLGFGLDGVNKLGLQGENVHGIQNAVDFIEHLRQAPDKSTLPVGRRVVVIGGGMTAIDVAVQSKRLGSELVDIVYRRGPEQMSASRYEQDFARSCGVSIRHWSAPTEIAVNDGVITMTFEKTTMDENGRLSTTGETWTAEADIVYKAVGQAMGDDLRDQMAESLEMTNGRLVVDEERRTSLTGVWAGGDCVYGNDDLTVSAVQDGKLAAHSIDRYLRDGASDNG